MPVRLQEVGLERVRAFGDVWLGWTLWRALRLDTLCALEYDLLLYDVTSTYFEGQAEKNPPAARRHSRDHRPDCKQVCIALVVTREGILLGYEVFAGNRVDVTTVEEIVGTIEELFGLAQRVWVMDRGMASADNLACSRASGRRYLIGASRSEARHWSRKLTEARDWRTVRDGVEVKLCTRTPPWQTYNQLAEAETAFRIHKSELSLRPVWHQKQDRVQAHILVCFLADVLWKTLDRVGASPAPPSPRTGPRNGVPT